MFFDADRIAAVREMILSDDVAGRRATLGKLLPMQRAGFAELFTIMSGLSVTIRLLDPPLHEFLPHTDAEMPEVAAAVGASVDVRRRAVELHEFDPRWASAACGSRSRVRKLLRCRRWPPSRVRSRPADHMPASAAIMLMAAMSARLTPCQGPMARQLYPACSASHWNGSLLRFGPAPDASKPKGTACDPRGSMHARIPYTDPLIASCFSRGYTRYEQRRRRRA